MKIKKVDLLDFALVVILVLIFTWAIDRALDKSLGKGGRPERVGLFL